MLWSGYVFYRPILSATLLKLIFVKVLLPEKPIKTPHELDLPCEKYKLLSNMSFHLISFSFVEFISCKNKIPLGFFFFPELLLR